MNLATGRVIVARVMLASMAMVTCMQATPVHAQRVDPDVRALRAIIEKPETEIDLARAKLTIDRIIDPAVDIEGTLAKLDAMAATVKALAGPRAKSSEITRVLRSYLYDAGPWNNQQPFRYDLEGDPLGHSISGKLLATYLRTRKGNCVSMPTLFVLLAQKLGLEATFAASPGHVFVKYRDETGRWYNLETTSGGYPRKDESYQRDTPMTPQALKNGIYLRPLSRKESVAAVMIGVLLDHYTNTGRPERVIAIADVALEHYPSDINAMLRKGYAYYLLLRDFRKKYPRPSDAPIEGRLLFQALELNNRLWYEKAEALGWREPDAGADARYQEIVKAAKPN
ncbi:transglutaminase family protein [Variovorax soli]|uniref:Regulator of sirC expression with transglutaminase-like and TPR domain n=1 Tax=Variovorax soli TaxID=376815 RepID=A0ABU1ND96_9BURK|nr:transglutaminase family protein [Variovorax soli]MDR6536025.1 regulator of sirC expression with transglutaminase-like and TPR domain [Variovorax soli]